MYHISTDSPFEKKVELTLEHFAELETEKQASEMTFFKAKSVPTVTDGREEFIFSPIEGGRFAVGDSHCTLSTEGFSLVSAGTKGISEIRKNNVICVRSYCSLPIAYYYVYTIRKTVRCAVQLFE